MLEMTVMWAAAFSQDKAVVAPDFQDLSHDWNDACVCCSLE